MLRHSVEYGIERPWAHVITVVTQFLHHPLPVHTMLLGVMQDVDLPEAKQKFPLDRIAHSVGGYRKRKIGRQ